MSVIVLMVERSGQARHLRFPELPADEFDAEEIDLQTGARSHRRYEALTHRDGPRSVTVWVEKGSPRALALEAARAELRPRPCHCPVCR